MKILAWNCNGAFRKKYHAIANIRADIIVKMTRPGLSVSQVVAGLDELGDDIQQYIALKKQQLINAADEAANGVIEYAVESVKNIAINWIRGKLNDYLSPLPRVR